MKDSKLYPLLLGFFVMGFVDIVGIATNYVKVDFHLSGSIANLLPMMVFVWFALFSIPTGILMNRYGKRNIVIASLLITVVAMLLMFFYTFAMALVAFALIGIGNTMLQVSLNPMAAETVDEKRVMSTLTLGQFFKSISSFLGPILVGLAAVWTGNWLFVFALYALIAAGTLLWIKSSIKNKVSVSYVSSVKKTLGLLGNKRLLQYFIGILLIVGIDVGLNITIPKYLMLRCGITLDMAALGTSLYFAAKITGTLVGAAVLTRLSGTKVLRWTMVIALITFIAFLLIHQLAVLLVFIFIIGLSCANVFSILFTEAIQIDPQKNNDISALMIMAVAGGAFVPPIMGYIADHTNQTISLIPLAACIVYLLYLGMRRVES
jgi:FHS family L-fucose permease-like MFS transporter